MDFGMDVGLVCSSSNTTTSTTLVDSSDKLNLYGSGFSKQEKFGISNNVDEDSWRNYTKVAKISNNVDDFSISKTMLQQRSTNTSIFSDGQQQQQQMLSFSSPNLQTMSSYYSPSTTPYTRNGGYGYGGLNSANMHGILTEPFTPSQWMELQHQALIYKYITSNSPVPSNLLNPIRKALDSAGLSRFPGTHLWPNTLGWGAFQLGFSNNTDPEPGRCRRTDGKKWRCSRDAVADQKYCERHVNRGRHRSRKPVEGQTNHSDSGATNTTAKFLPMSSSTLSAPVVPARGTSNNLGLFSHQLTNLQDGAPNPSAADNLTRSYLNKASVCEKTQDTTGVSTLSGNIGLKQNQFLTQKQCDPRQEPSMTEFGFVCSDSLLNPLQKSTSLISYDSSKGDQSKSQHSFRQFMDEWPINQCDDSSIPWHAIDMQSDRTQLSIAIPMAASDFMSSTSSPTNQSRAISPLRLSRELDSTQMGLDFSETDQRQANWIPISWENSMGGPLGEVLHSSNNSAGDFNDTSALNLMTEGWDNSPRIPSSPTGVLQKTTFRSLSNSSAGSSPRTDNNLIGMHHIGSSLPAL